MKRLIACLCGAGLVCGTGCGSDPATGTDDTSAVTGAGGADADVADRAAADAGPSPLTDASLVVTVDANESCAPGSGDMDGDGFSVADGDCNDCDKVVNPGAYDFPGNAFDEDCSGRPAESADAECDKGLDIASTAAEDAARAIGLCKFTSPEKKDWGVISARFTTADGTGTLDSPLQVGLVPMFGVVAPRAGSALLALSSGVARAPDQPGYTQTLSDDHGAGAHSPPAGFPKASSVCPATPFDGLSKRVFNQAALELKLRVPTNAHSLSFDSIFYSYEYPDYICQPANDFFIALLEPSKTPDGNIVFDSNGDPIGVNTGLLAVCDPSIQSTNSAKQFACEQGTQLLSGTGFAKAEYSEPGLFGTASGQGGASTGWLTTAAPTSAGSVITLRFALWDTGDAQVDSTVLVDRFAWSVEQPSAPVTKPTPVLL